MTDTAAAAAPEDHTAIPDLRRWAITVSIMLATLDRQAAMLAYIGDFKTLLVLTFLCAPLLLILRRPKGPDGETHVVTE